MESFVLIKPDAVYNKVLRRIIITEIQNKNISDNVCSDIYFPVCLYRTAF